MVDRRKEPDLRMHPSDWTEEQDNAIRKAYSEQRSPVRYLMSQDSRFAGLLENQIRWRAKRLGLRVRSITTPAELALIKQYGADLSVAELAELFKKKGYRRSPRTIEWLVWRHQRSTKPDAYTVRDLGRLLYCDTREIARWIREGKLKATKDPNGGSHWRVRPLDLVMFFRSHVFEIDGMKIDMVWLLALFEECWTEASRRMRNA
jgi:hypothetical protein